MMEHVQPNLFSRRLTTLLVVSVLISLPLLAPAADNIGIAAVATDVTIEGKGEFNINDEVSVGDVIKTGEEGTVTILFNDESMLTLGPNSSARLDSYSETPPGEARLTILSGKFRYFPGSILEQGGKQTVVNQGATTDQEGGDGTDVTISETGLSTTIEGREDIIDVSISELNANELTNSIVLTDTTSGSSSAVETGSSTSGTGTGDL